MICVSSRAIVTNSFISVTLRRVKCAKHCALDFGDFGVLHGVHQCDLGASRVALRLGCCVLLTEGCDQRDILQHLLSHFVVVRLGVAGAVSSDCSIEGELLSSSDDSLPGGAVRLTVSELSWLAGWLRGRGPELLLRYHVRVAHVTVVHWARDTT